VVRLQRDVDAHRLALGAPISAFYSEAPLGPGVFLVRATTPLDAHTVDTRVAVVDGGADVEATFETHFTVGHVAAPE
jgi:hypothetical protein